MKSEDKLKELVAELSELSELTKDYGLFKHIFSDDDGVETLAKIRRSAKQIELLVELSSIKKIKHPEEKPIRGCRTTGKFVKIRPCGEKYKDKTYLGIYIGDAALSSSISIKDDAILCDWNFFNPAILIPELGEIVYGCESWWGEISSEKDLESITDIDIENVWYVKAMKQLQNKETNNV